MDPRATERRSELLERIDRAQEACSAHPKDRDAWVRLWDLLEELGDPLAAATVAQHCTSVFLDWAEPWYRLARANWDLGDLQACLRHARQAVELEPTHVRSQALLGLAEVDNGFRREGSNRILDACVGTNDPFVIRCRALAHFACGEVDQAEFWLAKASRAAPSDPLPVTVLAQLYEGTHRLDACLELLDAPQNRRLLEGNGAAALTRVTALRRVGRSSEALAVLDTAHEDPDRPVIDPRLAAYERGRVLEQLGRFGEAFASFTEANRIAAARSPYGNEMLDWFDRVSDWWRNKGSRPAAEPAPPVIRSSSDPLAFLIGFPRSGSTLLEQILTTDPRVRSTEEAPTLGVATAELVATSEVGYPEIFEHLDEAQEQRFRVAYERLATPRRVDADELVVDKLPLNVLYLPAANRVFRESKVVMMLRDPRHSVLSAFVHQFVDNPAMSLTNTLAGTVALFDRVMRLWQATRDRLDIAWFELRYDDLVMEPDRTVRDLERFLGITVPWSPTAEPSQAPRHRRIRTPSYDSATGPVHENAGERWDPYLDHLEPHLVTLQPWIDLYQRAGGTSS